MTLPLERARSRRPVTWLTIVGVLLLPVVIGGLLVAALYNPTERLDAMSTAIVNNDEPVTIDGQLAPLGRQLTAGLVEGSDDVPSNLDWTISNDEDAAAGLADGTYDAVVTIPDNFSAAATSTAPGGTPERATIEVETSPDSLIVDDAITAQVTQTAASVMGEQLSTVYLENVFLGFTTLGDQLGDAADGASQLADGATQASDGAVSLADGVRQLSSGAGDAAAGSVSLADGVRQLSSGAGGLAAGADGIGDGASRLASGAAEASAGLDSWAAGAAQAAAGQREWAAGASDAASGLQTWAGGATTIADGQRQIADALGLIAEQIPTDMPQVPQEAIDAANDIAANSDAITQQLTDAANQLSTLAAQCDATATPDACTALTAAAQSAQDALPTVTGVVDQADTIATGLEGLNQLPALGGGLSTLAQQSGQIADGLDDLATGAQDAAGGVQQLAGGAGALAAGSQELSAGAAALADGGAQLSSGAGALADGASQLGDGAGALATGAETAADGADDLGGGLAALADGATSAADGAAGLADGVGELATGTGTLADGLGTAVDQVPSYTDEQASDLASVVSDPVTADGLGSSLFGASAVPLLTALALWFGGLASFIALQAVPGSALSSRRPSALLALRSLAPAAGIGALQGFLVAGVVQLAADYAWSEWLAFAGLAMVAGVVFAAVNQALVAAFGGAGRWIAALVGVLAVATGVVSTVPGILSSVAALMPTTPAYNALLGALTAAGGVGAGVVGLIVWALLAFAVTTLAVARRRATTARAVLAASPV